MLDSGALSALAQEAERARAAVRRALFEERDVIVPAVVLAESTSGTRPRDAAVNRVLVNVDAIVAVDETNARKAGELRYLTACDETIDALVVAVAALAVIRGASPQATILTGEQDGGHLRELAAGLSGVAVVQV